MDKFVGCFIQERSDLSYVIANALSELQRQHILYAELTISIVDYLENGITLAEIMSCLTEAATHPAVHLQWIIDLERNQGNGAALELLKQILATRCDHIAGITLGGNEALFPPQQFAEVYHLAHHHGLRTTIHAGELLGPESIWTGLNILNVDRIGHGARISEDEQLISFLADQTIPVEMCPTSDMWMEVLPSYHEHPANSLFQAGVPITISSGTPMYFDTTLADEYGYLHRIGMSAEDIVEIMKNGFRYAFLPAETIATYLHMLEDALQCHARHAS